MFIPKKGDRDSTLSKLIWVGDIRSALKTLRKSKDYFSPGYIKSSPEMISKPSDYRATGRSSKV